MILMIMRITTNTPMKPLVPMFNMKSKRVQITNVNWKPTFIMTQLMMLSKRLLKLLITAMQMRRKHSTLMDKKKSSMKRFIIMKPMNINMKVTNITNIMWPRIM